MWKWHKYVFMCIRGARLGREKHFRVSFDSNTIRIHQVTSLTCFSSNVFCFMDGRLMHTLSYNVHFHPFDIWPPLTDIFHSRVAKGFISREEKHFPNTKMIANKWCEYFLDGAYAAFVRCRFWFKKWENEWWVMASTSAEYNIYTAAKLCCCFYFLSSLSPLQSVILFCWNPLW